MTAAIPVLLLLAAHQPQIDLVNQGRRLERLPGRFLRHPLRGQLTQCVIDQRQQLLRRLRIALFNGGQDLRHFMHVACRNLPALR